MQQFICVNCGSNIQELYKQYSATVLKVTSCQECHSIADKYIEYDPVIIIIDLILLNKQAYRHILYNTKFKNHWKLAVILLLMETYSEWINSPNIFFKAVVPNKAVLNDYQRETKFYFIYLQVLVATITFVATIYTLTTIMQKINKKKLHTSHVDTSLVTIWKSTTLSSFGRFLHLPALIWGDTKQDEMHFFFVLGYIILTQLLAHSVTMCCSRRLSIIIIFLGYLSKIYVTNFITGLLINLYTFLVNKI